MTSFVGWGGAWGDSWGPVTVDPNAMRGTAGLSITAAGALTAIGDGFMVGAAGFGFAAFGTLTAEGQPEQQPSSGGAYRRPQRATVDRRALQRAQEAQQQAAQARVEAIAQQAAQQAQAEQDARRAESERLAQAFAIASRQAEQAIKAVMKPPTIDVAAMDAALLSLRTIAAKAKATENRKRAALLAAALLLN